MTTRFTNLILLTCVVALAYGSAHAQTSKRRTRQRSGGTNSQAGKSSAEKVNPRSPTLNRSTAFAILKPNLPDSDMCSGFPEHNSFRLQFALWDRELEVEIDHSATDDELRRRKPIDFSTLPKGEYLDQKFLNGLADIGILRLDKIRNGNGIRASGPHYGEAYSYMKLTYAKEPGPFMSDC